QAGIMTERLEAAAQMVGTDAGLHPHEAWRHIGKPCFHLPARPLLSQHNRTLSIVADDMERVLTNINANHGNRGPGLLRHRSAPRLWRPLPASNTGGAGARPDHPISGPIPGWPMPLDGFATYRS